MCIVKSRDINQHLYQDYHCWQKSWFKRQTVKPFGQIDLPMTELRPQFRISKLRQLTKKFIHRCNACNKYGSTPFLWPTTGELPKDRTEGSDHSK